MDNGKITINDVPLQKHLKEVWTSEAGKLFQEDSRKYWHYRTKPRYRDQNGHGPVRKLEEWEIFVHQLDRLGRDIADMSRRQLTREYHAWKKGRMV